MTLKERAEQAISEGYKYCYENGYEDVIIKLQNLVDFPDDYEGKGIELCDKEPSRISISEDQISDFVIDHLNDQEEFYSEDWDDALDGCEELLKQLTDKINENLHKRNFYFNSGIQL